MAPSASPETKKEVTPRRDRQRYSRTTEIHPGRKRCEKMKYASVRGLLGVVLLMFLMQANPQDLCAQTTNGTILGTVHDSAGGVVPGTNVSARSTETGLVAIRDVAGGSCGRNRAAVSLGFH